METAHNLYPESNLVGISNIPDGSLESGRPAVILINAGFLHRVGPNRSNTTLARRLAELGFASLRMDLSGLGDSMSRSDETDDAAMVEQDLDRAMTFMRSSFGVERFVLLGLCSGAHDTICKSMTDTRVVGLVNIDGAGYRTRRFYINHFFLHLLRRVAQPARWRRLYQRYRDNLERVRKGQAVQGSILMSTQAYTHWTREEAGRNLQQLADRGVRIHLVYTGGVSGYYNYSGQFSDMYREFDFKEMASSSYFPGTDHLNMLEHHRNDVQQNIIDWMQRSFP